MIGTNQQEGKKNIYKIMIRQTMTHEAECLPIKKQHIEYNCSRDENIEMDVW